MDSHGLKHTFPLAEPLRPTAFKEGDIPWPLQMLHPLRSAGHGLHTAERKENPSLRSGKEHPMRLAPRKSLCRQWQSLAGGRTQSPLDVCLGTLCCWYTKSSSRQTPQWTLLTPGLLQVFAGYFWPPEKQWERNKDFWAGKEWICLPNYLLMSLWPSIVKQNYPRQTRLCTQVEHWH